MSQDLYSNIFQAEAEVLGKTVFFFFKEIQACCILKMILKDFQSKN